MWVTGITETKEKEWKKDVRQSDSERNKRKKKIRIPRLLAQLRSGAKANGEVMSLGYLVGQWPLKKNKNNKSCHPHSYWREGMEKYLGLLSSLVNK